jgi:Mu transposase-like protein/IstB-like ATP binding protein
MRPLPERLPDVDRRFVTRVPPDPYVRVDSNDYSLDPRLVGRRVELRVSQRKILAVALDTGELACRHVRSFARYRTITALEHARAEEWSYERFAEALLQTEVASRDAHGGEARIKQARFPARKTLEEFDFSFQRSVETPTRRIGRVVGIRYGERSNEPEVLEVRAGLFGRTLLLISVDDVAEIAAEERQILLNDPPRLLSE